MMMMKEAAVVWPATAGPPVDVGVDVVLMAGVIRVNVGHRMPHNGGEVVFDGSGY